MSDVEWKDMGFEALARAIGENTLEAKVGVLAAHNARSGDGEESNASIGMKHEFGLDGMPVRSWLRMPIAEKMDVHLEKAGQIDDSLIRKMVAQKSMAPLLELVALTGVATINHAFDTGGFGKWKKSVMKYKENWQTLVETHQLRESVTSEVK